MSEPDPAARLLERGREMFRDLAAQRRDAARDVQSHRRALHDLALAAVEAVEALSDATPPDAALDVVRRAALERLERAGIRFDGAAGEALDPTRHRVVKSRQRPGLASPVVRTVVRPGVSVDGARVRDAEVVIDEPEA